MAVDTSKFRWWLALQETSGNRADSTSYGHTFTDTNTVGTGTALATNFTRSAAFVRASSEYLRLVDNANVSLNNDDFFVCGWASCATPATFAYMCGQTNGAANVQRSWAVFINSSRINFQATTAAGVSTNREATNYGNVSANAPFFFYAQHTQGVGLSIAINNGTANTSAHTGGVHDSTLDVLVGTVNSNTPGTPNASYWDGLIGPIGFGKGLLTAGEQTELYNAGAGYDPFAFNAAWARGRNIYIPAGAM